MSHLIDHMTCPMIDHMIKSCDPSTSTKRKVKGLRIQRIMRSNFRKIGKNKRKIGVFSYNSLLRCEKYRMRV